MRRSIFYQPLALLLALLLVPDFSWMTNTGGKHPGGPFQAAAQSLICATDGSNGTSSTQIVNTCRWPTTVSSTADWIQFQNDVIAEYLRDHELPPEDASTIFTYGRAGLRSEIRGLMLARLLNIIKTPDASREPLEKSIYRGFQKALQPTEIQFLTATINEWNTWRNDPCHYTLDAEIASVNGLTYSGAPYCFGGGIGGLLGSPVLPGAQYFEAVGTKHSYNQLLANNAGIAASTITNAQLAIAYGAAVGGAIALGAIIAAAASLIFPFSVGAAVAGEIVMTAVVEGVTVITGTVSAGEFIAVAVLGPAAIISLAIFIGVIQGFQVFDNQAQIDRLNALSASLAAWQAAPQDLNGFLGTADGLNKLNAVFTSLTTPEVESTAPLPIHRPGLDPLFVITPSGQTTPLMSEQMNFKGWLGTPWTMSTYGGWLVQSTTSDGVFHDHITPSIHYLDWNFTRYAATRKGFKFLVSKVQPLGTDIACPADPATGVTTTVTSACYSYVASSIQLKDANSNNVTVALGLTPSFTSSASSNFAPGVAKTFTIAATGFTFPSITATGALPSGVSFTAGNPATLSGTAAAGTEGAYPITLKAQNSAGTVTQSFTLNVGTLNLAFTSPVETTFTVLQPSSFTITTTGSPKPSLSLGRVPPGMTFTDNGNGTATLSGTPTALAAPGTILPCPTSGCGVTAMNAFGSVYQDLKIYVVPVPLTISSNPPGLPFTVAAGTSYCNSTGSYTASKTFSLGSDFISGAESCAVEFASPISGTTGTRYQFEGWTDQSDPVNPRVFEMPSKPTTFTANFKTQYFITTSASSGGTISLPSGWYNGLGLSVTVVATPDPGYAFTGFTGDLTGTANPQSITLNRPQSIKANFGVATATTLAPVNAKYGDSVSLSATISAVNPALSPSVAGSLQFSVDGVNVGSPVTVAGAGPYTVPYTITQAQGPYNIKAAFAGGTGIVGGIASNTLTVARENATVTPSANNPTAVQVGAPGGTGSFKLTVAIQEAAGGSLGDISKATPITFTLNPLVAAPQITCPVGTSVAAGILTAVATCSNVPVNVYDVTASIGGNYYTGSAESVIAVFDPSLGGVTGGGIILRNGVPTPFGVNAKYNKSGQPQGAVMYIGNRESGGVTVKSNSLQSLSITSNTAVIIGKATVGGVGNYTFQATAIGNGMSASDNLFGLQVTDPSGKLVPDLSFSPINLKSGTVQVSK